MTHNNIVQYDMIRHKRRYDTRRHETTHHDTIRYNKTIHTRLFTIYTHFNCTWVGRIAQNRIIPALGKMLAGYWPQLVLDVRTAFGKSPFVLEWCKYELRLFLRGKYIFFWMPKIVTSVVETLKSSRLLNPRSNPCCILCLCVRSLMCVWWQPIYFLGRGLPRTLWFWENRNIWGFFPVSYFFFFFFYCVCTYRYLFKRALLFLYQAQNI